MRPSLPEIVKEAFEASSKQFCTVIERTAFSLSAENGEVGHFHVQGRLVRMKRSGAALIIGDLHGDLESLVEILQGSNIMEQIQRDSGQTMIFLGDYGDRGSYSAEVYYTILKLRLHYPAQIVLMRGNHEGPKDLMASPHDLPEQLQSKFGTKWTDVYTQLLNLHQYLYTSLIVEDSLLMVHGGLSPDTRTIDDLAFAHLTHPKQSFLEDMLWSDPDETVEQTIPSPRGAGGLFGRKVTDKVLEKLNVNVLIRGHESCEEGFKTNHAGKVLTLFSRRGAPYFNTRGAYLDLGLSEKVENADQLLQYIHTF